MAVRKKAKAKAKSKPKKAPARKAAVARKKAPVRKKAVKKTAAKKKAPARRAAPRKAAPAKKPPAPRAPAVAPAKSPAAAAPAAPRPARAPGVKVLGALPPVGALPKSGANAGPVEERVGVVTHYYSHLSVASVWMEAGTLAVGDTVHISGHTSDFRQRIDSMQVEHQDVTEVTTGQEFGLKVIEHAREHDVVYKVLGPAR